MTNALRKGSAEFVVGVLAIAIMVIGISVLVIQSTANILFTHSSASGIKEIGVSARMWEFYPSVMKVKQGDKVRIVMTSLDAIHGLMVNLPDGNMIHGVFSPSEDFRFEFNATSVGRYPFHCNVYCGIGHNDMKGFIVVES